MAKYTKEELSEKINDLDIDDALKISLMEDVSDSVEDKDNSEVDNLREELKKAQDDYLELQEKYKSRFLAGDFKKENNIVEDKKEKELEEKEVIDIREI